MHPVLARLLAAGPVVTDGAWGTELQKRGLPPDEPPDVWNLTHPEHVLDVARSYVAAGSRVILTNTFGANRLRLGEYGLAPRLAEINRRGVALSKEAAGSRALVFASIGPSGKLLWAGDVSAEELSAAFAEQARALADAGADALVVETMSDLEEAGLALAAARTTSLPVVVCLVFDAGRDKDRTMTGLTPEAAARALTRAGADVVGANCGVGIEGYALVCRRLRTATDRPIWIKPNAGVPALENGRVVYHTSAAEFAAHVPDLVAAGANFIGGCCGTDPAFIRAVAACLARPTG